MQSQQAYQDTYCREAGALPVPFLGVACDVEATHGCRADTGGEGNLCFAPSVAVSGRLNASECAREILTSATSFVSGHIAIVSMPVNYGIELRRFTV